MNDGNDYGFGGALTSSTCGRPRRVVPPVEVPPTEVPPGLSGLPEGTPAMQDVVALKPSRLADTRAGMTTTDGLFAGGGIRSGGSTRELTVAGGGGVDAAASAVALNVTAGPLGSGFVTAYPCGTARRTTSNLNYTTGGTVSTRW